MGGAPVADLDAVYAELLRLEDYLAMAAQDYAFVRDVIRRGDAARPWEWARVDAVIEKAHRQRQVSRRRDPIRACMALVYAQNRRPQIRFGRLFRIDVTDVVSARAAAQAVEAGARLALGDPAQNGDLPGGRALLSLNVDRKEDRDYAEQQLHLSRSELDFLLGVGGQRPGTGLASGEPDWARVAQVLETARSRKENWTPAPLEFRRWENLYAATDARQVVAQRTEERSDATPHWRTFGAGPEAGEATAPRRSEML